MIPPPRRLSFRAFRRSAGTNPAVAQSAVNQITIPEGEIEGTFSVTTAAVAADTPVVLRAVAVGKIASATLLVSP